MTTEWTIRLPYLKPPLSLNYRMHWRAETRWKQQIHSDMAILLRASKIPRLRRARMQLHWSPPDRRRRDADNLAPTSKVMADSLVRAEILEDDNPTFLDHLMPAIDPPGRPARMWLTVEAL